jgi:N4-(beta-N-acetylglucosaminyl)-L-asparaginase
MTTRRGFLRASAGIGAGAALGVIPHRSLLSAPTSRRSRVTPVCIASGNGLAAVTRAMEVMQGGGDTLEAVLEGVSMVERDPQDTSVGYGGLPNLDGVVQLDSSVMHGPTRGAGAVASLEGVMTPSLVARDVMRYTDHVLLVGPGAQSFARSMGYVVEDLLTEEARRRWVEWRARLSDRDFFLTPEETLQDLPGFRPEAGYGDGLLDSHDGVRPQGTINCNALDESGSLSGVTTTSGMAWKIPGRVGDSPIIGAGLYVDNDVGACGSTGRGEAVIKTVGSHAVVELMRGGMHPKDACLDALRRIVRFTVEPRLQDGEGRPNFNVSYYAVNKNGEYASAAIWAGARFAVSVDGEARYDDSAYLFQPHR